MLVRYPAHHKESRQLGGNVGYNPRALSATSAAIKATLAKL